MFDNVNFDTGLKYAAAPYTTVEESVRISNSTGVSLQKP